MIILKKSLVKYILLTNINRLKFLLIGIVDSSGMRLYYTDRPRQEDAAILSLGHAVVGHMIVPPRVQQYVIHGFCSSNCTDEVSVKASEL